MARIACLILLCLAAASPCYAQSEQAGPAIRVNVNRVNVGVTVVDIAGNFVEGLRREDFRVFDNGVEQPITDFLSLEEPAQVLLLVESGPAVLFLSKNHLLVADQLLTSLAANDRVAIASYTRAPEALLPFTENKLAARAALQSIGFANGYGDLNLSKSLSTALDWVARVAGKKTIVLLSTGVDTSPPDAIEAARKKLLTNDVRVLAVSLSGDFRSPAKRKKLSPGEKENRERVQEGFQQADDELRELTSLTGGRVYSPQNAGEFNRAYAEIAQLIRHEYSLAFAPPANDGQLHSLKVKTKSSSYQVDHRQAYFAPAAN
jgi:Ca-activated chloride channel family protein